MKKLKNRNRTYWHTLKKKKVAKFKAGAELGDLPKARTTQNQKMELEITITIKQVKTI